MKTTVDLPDALVREAQQIARERNRTFRSLLEDGLRKVVAEQRAATEFRLVDVSVPGNGLQAEFVGAEWHAIRDAAYGAPR